MGYVLGGYAHMIAVLLETRRGHWLTGDWSCRWLWATWCWDWELNSVLNKQQMLFTAKPPLRVFVSFSETEFLYVALAFGEFTLWTRLTYVCLCVSS